MDTEKLLRRQLIEHLKKDFLCVEEVSVRPALFPRHVVRADVVALPINPEHKLFDSPIAFEVKNVDEIDIYDLSNWSKAIKQASDYVYATIEPDKRLQDFAGRRIIASFVFPAPPFQWSANGTDDPDGFRKIRTSSAFHLASYFKVGAAQFSRTGNQKESLTLYMGRGEVWTQNKGWSGTATNHLSNKRKLGSQNINVLAELDGTGVRPDGFPWDF